MYSSTGVSIRVRWMRVCPIKVRDGTKHNLKIP